MGVLLGSFGLVFFLLAGHFAVALPETPRADFLAPLLAGAGTLCSFAGYAFGRTLFGKRLATCVFLLNGAATLLLLAALL